MIFDELKSGHSFEGREISVFKSDTSGKEYIYLIAGIFGQKVEGIYVISKLFDWLSNTHQMKDIPLIIVPILNIDGYENQTAENSAGIKLIENFNQENLEKKPEIQFLFSLLKKYPAKSMIHFSAKKPPKIQFSEGGKHIASFISKFNFYELFKVDSESLDKKKSLSFPYVLLDQFDTPLIEVQFPKLSEKLGLEEIWKHNEKSFKDLFTTDFLHNYLFPKENSK